MKTKNIFKTLAFAMMMPAVLLTTACSSEDELANNKNIDNTEAAINKGFSLPVTVSATRQGDSDMRAAYTDNGDGTGSLAFSAGDKLFVEGRDKDGAEYFAGALDYVPATGKFTGTIYTQNEWLGTADELFEAANADNYVLATLLPAGYKDHGYLYIDTDDPDAQYDDYINESYEYTLATSKADGVAQFSLEYSDNYNNGFALSPDNAILNFTITGLAVSTSVNVSLTSSKYNITGTVTTDASGNATFAAGISGSFNLKYLSLTVAGNPVTLVSSDKVVAKGKIYNITRGTGATVDLSTKNTAYTAQNGETLTGTLASNVQISIADGATVILNNVNINGSGTWTSGDYAGITCEGDATIILSGTNTVRGFSGYYPGLQAGPAGKTLTIKGTGSLTALCANVKYPGGTGIGAARNEGCGNIVIEGGNITATGGYAGIGGAYGSAVMGSGTCGDITITGGTVTATALSYGAGIGAGRGEYGSCGNITISGGTVTAIATAKNALAAAIGAGSLSSTCTSVTIGTGITSLTMTNGYSSATGIVSNFINATEVYAKTTPITTMLSMSVTDATITGGMTSAGFATLYNEGTKTWTITKK